MKKVNSDVAYDYIRQRILNGEYLPGRALLTESIAKEINISRTPVRDALRRLETDGLVIIRPHLGASVKQMQLKEFRELCELRLALESHAAGLAAANHTDADLREIQYALEAMRRLTNQIIASPQEQEQAILAELATEDVRFHIAIMMAAKNELMKKEILRLHLINRLLISPGSPQPPAATTKAESDARRRSVMGMHDNIFTAISNSDAKAAKHEMEFHLQEFIDRTLFLMTRAESGVLVRELTAEELAYNSQ